MSTVRPYPAGSACNPGGAYAGLCGAGMLDAERALLVSQGVTQRAPIGAGSLATGGGGGGALAWLQLLLLGALLVAPAVCRDKH